MAQHWDTPQTARANRWAPFVIYGLLGSSRLVYLLPLVVMLLTSFKPLTEIYSGSIIAWPQQWTIEP
jgi:glucose/mannose transport system permease protein